MKTAEIRIKLKQWSKKLVLFLLAILAIFVVSRIIISLVEFTYNPQQITRQEEIKNVYDTPIFGDKEIDDEKKEECSSIIGSFVNYGNAKDYQKIYDMLSNDYKLARMQSIEQLKIYIDTYFDSQKSFSYRNLTNAKDKYIYEVKIQDDLMLSGSNSYTSNNQDKIYFVINDIDNELRIGLDGFISKENVNVSSKNEYMKFTVLSKEVYYDKVKFNLQIENLTDNRILSVYDKDINYLLYNKNSEKITRYSRTSTTSATTANSIMPKVNKNITLEYSKYIGNSYLLDYRINIDKVYSYDLIDYMEVLFDNPDIVDKAKETYSNIYISL